MTPQDTSSSSKLVHATRHVNARFSGALQEYLPMAKAEPLPDSTI
jgi:hypothetical protein